MLRQDVDILLQDDGSFTHTDYEIANTLNKFFTSVFTKRSQLEKYQSYLIEQDRLHHVGQVGHGPTNFSVQATE